MLLLFWLMPDQSPEIHSQTAPMNLVCGQLRPYALLRLDRLQQSVLRLTKVINTHPQYQMTV